MILGRQNYSSICWTIWEATNCNEYCFTEYYKEYWCECIFWISCNNMTIPQAVPLLKQLLRRDRLKVKSSRKVKNEPLWWKKNSTLKKSFLGNKRNTEHLHCSFFALSIPFMAQCVAMNVVSSSLITMHGLRATKASRDFPQE